MSMSEREPSAAAEGPLRLGDFILRHRTLVLEEWARAVRLLLCVKTLPQPWLINQLPGLLERVANLVNEERTEEPGASALEGLPRIHAVDRLDVGFDLEEVTGEYSLLRICILRLYRQHLQQAGGRELAEVLREVERFDETFDGVVSIAVSHYSRVRERTLVALDRISEAALGSEDLDTFLPRLLRVILETTEAVDSVTLLLLEGDTLRVRASVGLEMEMFSGFSQRVGEGFAGKIAAERQPLELRSAATEPLVRSRVLREQGIRALYGVPLVMGEELIGVAHMGSRSTHEFSNEDKLLFRAMVNRLTSILVQAGLAARERVAREELETRERLLRLVVEQSGDAIVMADEQGVLRLFNVEAERLHGVSRQEVVASKWSSTFGLCDLEGRPLSLEETPLYRALHGEVVTGAHWLVRRPDGSVRTLAGTASPLRRPDGSPAGAVLTARDETERHQREAEKAETLALLDTLLATAPIGLAFVDRELRYVRINSKLAAINGVPVEATLGRTLREVLPEQAPRLEPLHRHVFETGEPVMNVEFSWPSAGDSDNPCYFRVSYYPVRDARGEVRWVGTVVMDVTESKRIEAELRRTAEFRERFLGIVSHDLRNPLNAILLSANALIRAEDLPTRHLKSVRRVVTSAERMARMIGDLLDFTRGRLGGGIPITRQTTNLYLVCRHVLEELEAAHPGRELLLEAEGDFHGEWDPDRLAQVLGNLGKNALDYGAQGAPVRFTLRDEGDTVRVEVHNEGPPIPQKRLASIFEPFRRVAEEGGPTSGLGLGLYIVRQIIRSHGGTVEVSSTEEEGTTFTVSLPRRAHEETRP